MATPDEINKLKYDDKLSYDFILEAQGLEVADKFLQDKLVEYQKQEAAVILQDAKLKAEEDKKKGVEPSETPSLILTPEQQKSARRAIDDYLERVGAPRQELPGIPPSTAQQIPMEDVILQRRTRIPTPAQIQTQAELGQADIKQQGLNLGMPSGLGLKRTMKRLIIQEWEKENGPLADRLEAEQAILDLEFDQLAEQRAAMFPTAEQFATDKIQGEYGVSRPRQAGNPFQSPPTPRIVPRSIDPTGNVGGSLLQDPESVREMGLLDAFIESVKPQTIMTAEEVRVQDAQKEQLQQQFIMEVRNTAPGYKDIRGLDQSARLQRLSAEEARIRQLFSDFYFRNYDENYKSFRKAGVEENAAQTSAKSNAIALTREQIALIPDAPKYNVIRQEMAEKYGRMAQITEGEYSPFVIKDVITETAITEGSQLLKDMTTEPTPFTGEITESIGMTVIRNINLPFRLVLNPIEEAGENIFTEQGKAGQNVGDSFYDVATIDLTEEVSGFLPTMDAYLKEVAVENARGYGLGNALANYNQTESGSDGLMIGGTVLEMIVPWGTLAKGSQKLATTIMPLNKMARGLDLAADARGLTRIGQATGNPNIYTALTEIKPTTTIGYFSDVYSVNNKIAYESARQMEAVDAARQYSYYLSRGADEQAAAVAGKMDADKVQKSIFQQLIPLEEADAARRFDELNGVIDDIAKQDSIYGDQAKIIKREGRIDLADDEIRQFGGKVSPDGKLGPIQRGGASTEQIVEAGAERLSKYNIEDYVAFTDRMAVSKEALADHIDEVNEIVIKMNKTDVSDFAGLRQSLSQKMIRRDPELRRILDKLDGANVKRNRGDLTGRGPGVSETTGTQHADIIFMDDVLSKQEQVYLMNRVSEDVMRNLVGEQGQRAAAFRVTQPDAERALRPTELRSESGVAELGQGVERLTRGQGPIQQGALLTKAAGNYIKSITPGYVSNTLNAITPSIVRSAPKVGVAAEIGDVRRAVDLANQSVVRLERALPEAMSVYGRLTRNPDEAIYAMFKQSTIGDPTIILRMSDDEAKALFQARKAESIAPDEQVQILKGLFPNFNAQDEVRYLSNPKTVNNLRDMEKIAMDLIEEVPRLKTGMVSRAGVSGLKPVNTPDVAKVMLANMGNNAAKYRVADVARAELSPLSVPAAYRTKDAEEFIFKQAQDFLEYGDFPEDFVIKNRANAAGVRVVDDLRVADESMRTVLERKFLTVDDIKDDIIDTANLLQAKGLELNLTPKQVRTQIQYNIDGILEPGSGLAIQGVGVQEELAKLRQLYSEPETFRVVGSNIEELSKNSPGLLNWTKQTLGLTAGDIRRSFVSGMLGGKYFPTTRYITENAGTQMVLSAITAPGANRLLLKPFTSNFGITAAKVRTYAKSPDQALEIMPGTRFTYGQVNEAMNRYNLGSTQQTINLGDVFLEDMVQQAAREARTAQLGNVPYFSKTVSEVAEQFKYIGKNPGLKASSSSPGMRIAMNTDYYFRENLFIGALQDGKTFDEAAELARTAFLDYGNLPQWSKESWFRGALYFSFTYRTAVETAKALASPKGAANIARLARAHTAMAKYTGTYYYTGDQALQSLFITSQEGDEKTEDIGRAVNLYYRDPWMSQMITGAEALTFLTQAAQGDPEASISRGLNGILDFIYMPALDVVRDLDPDFKKGVPPKTMYRILLAQQYAGNIPFFFDVDTLAGNTEVLAGQAFSSEAPYYVDRYDLEVRPPSKMIPGQPTYQGFQYRFRSKEGYNRFYLDSLVMTMAGAKRLGDDITGLLIAAGQIPEGTEFGYLENGSPALFLLGRETPIRVPADWENYDRQMRAQQFRIKDLRKTYGEPVDTKAGDQK